MKNLSIILITLLFAACGQTSEKPETLPEGVRKIVSTEVLQTSSYTYVKGDENGNTTWVAIKRREVELEKAFYFSKAVALEMRNFKSKELNRVFETIYFLADLSDSAIIKASSPNLGMMTKKTAFVKQKLNLNKADSELSLAKLFENKKDFENKEVQIRAQVTKFSSNIMGKNWIHLQDGSEFENNFDLTITSAQTFKVGDIVTIKGIVKLNKNFGGGYSYSIIIEEAIKL